MALLIHMLATRRVGFDVDGLSAMLSGFRSSAGFLLYLAPAPLEPYFFPVMHECLPRVRACQELPEATELAAEA